MRFVLLILLAGFLVLSAFPGPSVANAMAGEHVCADCPDDMTGTHHLAGLTDHCAIAGHCTPAFLPGTVMPVLSVQTASLRYGLPPEAEVEPASIALEIPPPRC